jgi:hypothetical protein
MPLRSVVLFALGALPCLAGVGLIMYARRPA